MQRIARWVGTAVGCTAVGMQFIRPPRTSPPTDPSRTLAQNVPITRAASMVIDRACRDCHSNDTRWPWYSHVAPVSWFVINHVNHGRRHLNLSEWTRYDRIEAARLLENACALARKRDMPLPQYTWMHRTARLGESDVEALCGWIEKANGGVGGNGVRNEGTK